MGRKRKRPKGKKGGFFKKLGKGFKNLNAKLNPAILALMPIMRKTLKKMGIPTKGKKNEQILTDFYYIVVKKDKNYAEKAKRGETFEHFDLSAIVEAILTFFKGLKKAKEEGKIPEDDKDLNELADAGKDIEGAGSNATDNGTETSNAGTIPVKTQKGSNQNYPQRTRGKAGEFFKKPQNILILAGGAAILILLLKKKIK